MTATGSPDPALRGPGLLNLGPCGDGRIATLQLRPWLKAAPD